MLSYLLGIIQEFERSHGRRPQFVCLNERHLQQLTEECPGLLNSDAAILLGFSIMVLPEAELPHPKAVWVPTRTRPLQRRARVSSALLASIKRPPYCAEKN